jgi:hypothetical protein
MLVELGILTHVLYRDAKTGRRRAMRLGMRTAPILAYDPKMSKANLVVVYPLRVKGKASATAMREYQRTHWGRSGEGVEIDGLRAPSPMTRLGEVLRVTYTTEKGGDSDYVDYVHASGDGAKGTWLPPQLEIHRCKDRRCEGQQMIALRGGTYRVTEHGIVG